MQLSEALIYSVIGLTVVFAALFAIWALISLVSLFFKSKPAAAASSVSTAVPASVPGVTLIDTAPKEAAAIMAIVSDTTQIPLAELRFKSIKLISGEEK